MKNVCGGHVAIIGAGFVGSATAYSLLLSGIATTITLIDSNEDKALGEALDLMHATQFTPGCTIRAGSDLALAAEADIVVLAAGANQKPGQSRSDLLSQNVAVFKSIVPSLAAINPTCMLLVVTNPLDVMTYVAYKLSGFTSNRVFGSGTVLDSARLRFLLGQQLAVSPKDIVAFVLGEHGDSEFVWWSGVTIGGAPISAFPAIDLLKMHELHEQTRQAAQLIISKKGVTNYAIASAVTKIIKALLKSQERIFSLSVVTSDSIAGKEICISLPGIIRKDGYFDRIPLSLTKDERMLLDQSAAKIYAETQIALGLISS